MRKITLFLITAALLVAGQANAGNAKYVFFLIGDGMGVNQVAAAEYYKAAVKGQLEPEFLNFHKFPVVSVTTTYNLTGIVPDSASAGTALATGQKTKAGRIGTDFDGNPLTSISELMLAKGRQVGVITSGRINDATPTAFYGHRRSRKQYGELVEDLAASGAAFIAGNGFYLPKGATYEDMARVAGRNKTFIRSLSEYESVKDTAESIVFAADEDNRFEIAVNRREGDGTTRLSDCLRTTIDFLVSKDRKGKGFFIMAEGSEIDHCAHKNDVAATVKEVLDFEEAVAVAIEFYNLHPKETAILVIADHDTGGIGLVGKGRGQFALLDNEKEDVDLFVEDFMEIYGAGKKMTWEEYKGFASERLGIWSAVKISEGEERGIKASFEEAMATGDMKYVSDEYKYGKTPLFIRETFCAFNRAAGFVWANDSHTAGFVPVFYQGPRVELFRGPLDNTDIFPILKAASGL